MKKLTVTQKLRKAQIAKGKAMRLQNKTNAEIAKATGLSEHLVRKYLGPQPKHIWMNSMRKAGAKRRKANEMAKLSDAAPRYIQVIYDTQNQQFSPCLFRIDKKLEKLIPPGK